MAQRRPSYPKRHSSHHTNDISEESPRSAINFLPYSRNRVSEHDQRTYGYDEHDRYESCKSSTSYKIAEKEYAMHVDEEAPENVPVRPSIHVLKDRERKSISSRRTYTREQIKKDKREVHNEDEIAEGIRDEGWLAAVICSDRKLEVYRRFEELTVEVLLGYVRKLEEYELRLSALHSIGKDADAERQELLEEIENVLMNYFDLLGVHRSNLKTKSPNPKDLKAYNHYRRLTFPHEEKYNVEEVFGLVPRPDDIFERITDINSPFMVTGRYIQRIKRAIHHFFFPHRPSKKLKKPRDWTSRNSFSAKLARWCITFLAPLMTLVPIIVLFYLPTAEQRLLTVVLFTLLFTFILGFSDASNADVLAGSTGYAAVLVVFVGTGAFKDGGA